MGKTTKYHEMLKSFEGTWDAVAKFGTEPGKPPLESKGVEVSRLSSEGLWLTWDYDSQLAGQPFIGHGLMGFDTAQSKFVACWVDNLSTFLQRPEGKCDEAGKTFTLISEIPGQQPGTTVKQKWVHEVLVQGRRTLSFSFPGPDGKDIVVGTIEYTRRR